MPRTCRLWAIVSSVLAEATAAKIDIRRDDGADVLLEALGGSAELAAMQASVPTPESSTWREWAGSYLTWGGDAS